MGFPAQNPVSMRNKKSTEASALANVSKMSPTGSEANFGARREFGELFHVVEYRAELQSTKPVDVVPTEESFANRCAEDVSVGDCPIDVVWFSTCEQLKFRLREFFTQSDRAVEGVCWSNSDHLNWSCNGLGKLGLARRTGPISFYNSYFQSWSSAGIFNSNCCLKLLFCFPWRRSDAYSLNSNPCPLLQSHIFLDHFNISLRRV